MGFPRVWPFTNSRRVVSAAGRKHSPAGGALVFDVLERRDLLAANPAWALLDQVPTAQRAGAQSYIHPTEYQALGIDLGLLQIQLQNAPLENTPAAQNPVIVSLPTPEGGFARFYVVESPIMEPGLAAKFAEIKTYAGQGIDDPTATLRFDLSPYGFHAQVLSPTTGTYLIDPYYHLDNSAFISYYKRDVMPVTDGNGALTDSGVQTISNLHNRGCICLSCSGAVPSQIVAGPTAERNDSATSIVSAGTTTTTTATVQTAERRLAARSGTQLRTYRLAVAANGEYTQFHGGTALLGQAAVVTAINRVTGIYESELSIRLTLVANNNLLIYTDPFTDPYTNTDAVQLLAENQVNIDLTIGDANYDIGHVFGTGGGGLASLGVVGESAFKAQGETGSSSPIGDAFYVDYVAHEMGHQFGANHTFNGIDGALGGNENPTTAYEPGSGSTIMAYAGIAISDDLQANSDPYFHSISFDEIIAYVSSGNGLAAAQLTPTGNIVPTVNAGADFSIPTGTPFVLTATGSDGNGDTLTYSWEQRDLGPQQALASPDNGSSPLFRVWTPTTDPSRTFPRLSDLVANTSNPGEVMPAMARTMNFRVTARDNRSGGGGVNTDDMVVDVIDTGAPFLVTSPNTTVTWTGLGSQTVTWDVAGTTAAPINAANVRILLSTDGGLTYPTVISASSPNDGSEVITVPNINTTTGRIRVEAVGNIFFDISNADITINAVAGGSVNLSPPTAVAVTEGGTTATYTLVLNTVPTANVNITVTPDTQTTVVPVAPLVFTPLNWSVPQTVTVTAANDFVAEGAHTGLLTHTASSGDFAYNGITINTITANITDNDTAGITITPSGGSTNLTEGGATDTYAIVLTSQPTGNVVVSTSATESTVSPVTSVTFTSGTWSSPQTLTITAIDDAAIEGPHTGVVSHTSTSGDPNYNAVAITAVTANITDNDALVGVTISPTGGSTDVTEAGTTDTYTVVLISAPTANVIITLSGGTQLTPSPATITFTPLNWNVDRTVTVTAVDDSVAEAAHTGTIASTATSSDLSYNGIAIAAVTTNITDNDSAGITVTQSGGTTNVTEGGATDTYTIVLTSQPTGNVVISTSTTETTVAPLNVTFTTLNWNTPRTLTVTATDDAAIEGPHTGVVSHTSASGDPNYNAVAITAVTANITDNDALRGVTITPSGGSTDVTEGGATDSYTVVLLSAPTANVIVTINAGTQLTGNPTTVTFTPLNWNIDQTVMVVAVNDTIAEGAHTGAINHTASSADTGYNGIAIAALTANITDNDTAGLTVVPVSLAVSEGAAGVPVSVVLNTQPTANVLVTLNPGTQLALSSSVLTFTSVNWNAPQLVTVTAVNDVLVEAAHNGTVAFTVASSDPTYNALAVPTLTAGITDNDVPGVTLSVPTLSVLEGATASYSAVLNVPPTANVTINISTGAFTTAAPPSLVFTPLNWNVPQTIVVSGVDNALLGNNVDILTHAAVSGDLTYNGLAIPSLNVTVIDNEGAPVLGTTGTDKVIVKNSADLSTINVSVNGKITSFASSVGQIIIDTLGGNDTIQIDNPLVPITIMGGVGKDVVTVTGQTSANSFSLDMGSLTVNSQIVTVFDIESLTATGKTGDDLFDVVNQPLFPVEFRGDLGNDRVSGADRANTWVVNNPNSGTLNSNIKLAAIENWTGGNSTDGFFFNSGKKITGQIDGGAGTNSLNYSLSTAAITVNLQAGLATGMLSFTSIAEVVGGKSTSDKLIGLDQVNTWNINTFNSGTVGAASFQNFENLVGGQLDDTFRIANGQGLKGKIDGGGGNNILDYSAFTRSLTINLQYGQATNLGGFANLAQIIAGTAVDTLIGANQNNDWTLSGTNVGAVNALAFSGFENLTGGIKIDTFNLGAAGQWTGLLNAATGNDILNSFAGGVYNITATGTGLLNGRKFQSCEVRR